MGRKIVRILSAIAFFVLLYAIYRFYYYTVGRMFMPEEVPGIVILGAVLIVLIGIIVASRYYYETIDKMQTTKHKELDAELKAYSILADKKKPSKNYTSRITNKSKN